MLSNRINLPSGVISLRELQINDTLNKEGRALPQDQKWQNFDFLLSRAGGRGGSSHTLKIFNFRISKSKNISYLYTRISVRKTCMLSTSRQTQTRCSKVPC